MQYIVAYIPYAYKTNVVQDQCSRVNSFVVNSSLVTYYLRNLFLVSFKTKKHEGLKNCSGVALLCNGLHSVIITVVD